jgi:hypothetical protein
VAHGLGMTKTVAQIQAEWFTHGNIAKIQATLDAETNESKRAGLEKLLAEQKALLLQP